MRRANHDKVAAPNLGPCPNWEGLMISHRVCPACGHYRNREVIAVAQD